jgi:hypothetical protein
MAFLPRWISSVPVLFGSGLGKFIPVRRRGFPDPTGTGIRLVGSWPLPSRHPHARCHDPVVLGRLSDVAIAIVALLVLPARTSR